jgi:hypothetical protein
MQDIDILQAQLQFLAFLIEGTPHVDMGDNRDLISAAEELSWAHSNYRDACFATTTAFAEVVRNQTKYEALVKSIRNSTQK